MAVGVTMLDPLSPSVAIVKAGAVIATISSDPTLNGVEVAGTGVPLPIGSVIRNSGSSQKFLKVSGNNKAFMAIPITPSADWNLASATSWDYLQAKPQ